MPDEVRQGFRSVGQIAQSIPPEPEYSTGLREIDNVLGGGLCSGVLNMMVGFAGNAKTATMLSMVAYQPDLHTVFLSADEPAWMVVRKLYAFRSGQSVGTYDRRAPEQRAKEMEQWYPNLTVVGLDDDILLDPTGVLDVIQRSELVHGRAVDVLMFDYAQELQGFGGSSTDSNQIARTKAQIQWLKQLATSMTGTVTVVGHQTNRQALNHCKELTMAHVASGGEQEVNGVMIGCRMRIKAESADLDEDDRLALEADPQVHVSIMKNKLNGKVTQAKGVQCSINKRSGKVQNYLLQGRPYGADGDVHALVPGAD